MVRYQIGTALTPLSAESSVSTPFVILLNSQELEHSARLGAQIPLLCHTPSPKTAQLCKAECHRSHICGTITTPRRTRGQAATSGMAESSRIAVDNQYRSDLNALGKARLSARAAAQNAADEQTAAAESSYYTAAENASLQQAQAALSQFNADRDYSLSVAGLTGFLNGTPTLGWRNYQFNVGNAEANFAASTQTRAYEQALERWKTSGYVRQSDAAILGVPAGTPTADVSYKNASLALQRWKSGYGY